MTEAFDPYRKWLGIPPAEQPPHYYRLLGIGLFEDDPDVIESAADQRMSHLRTFQTGVHSALSQKLLNEVAAAKLCLLSAQPRAAYDAELRRRLAAAETSAEPKRAETAAFPAPIPAPIALPATAAAPTIVRVGPAAKARGTASRSGRRSSPAIIWGACGGAAALLAMIAYLFSGKSEPHVAANQPFGNTERAVAPGNAKPPQAARKQAEAAPRTPTVSNAAADASAPTAPDAPHAPANVAAVSSNAATSDRAPPLAEAPFDAEQARAHQEAWAAHLKTPVEQQNSIGMPLVLIPPGEFTMGSTPEQIEAAKRAAEQENKTFLEWTLERIGTEAPAHRVTISRPFLLGATEVTIGQYRRFIEASSYVTETERLGGGSSTSKEEQDPAKKSLTWSAPSYPVDDNSAASQITWNDAVAFCNWLSDAEQLSRCYLGDEQAGWTLSPSGDGYRLPSEAEWEYACRAGTTTQYSFADDAATLAQYGWCSKAGAIAFPVAVGSKRPNPFRLYDMHGNVEEWSFDWFSPKYYAESPHEDPTGPAEGRERVKRGGAWDGPLVNARAALRHSYPPFYRFGDLGFRVVRVLSRASQNSRGLANNSSDSKMDATDVSGPPPAMAPFDAKQARAHQEAWAAYLKTPVEQKNSIDMPLVLIPPGEFTMGSTPEQIEAAKKLAEQAEGGSDNWSPSRIDAEAPAHRVIIRRPFLMGATEVTIGQYRRFVGATSYITETERFGGGSSTSKEEQDPQKKSLNWLALSYPASDESAVAQLTWNDAVAFCNWLSDAEKLARCYAGDEQTGWTLSPSGNGYRLPTEAEWEYACRAGTTTQYSFADDASTFAQYGWSEKAGPLPFPIAVASKVPNPFGLYDMHGNVAEWCHDWFAPDYYAQSATEDPTGPASGEARLRRGSGWNGPIGRCRSAFRGSYPPFWRFGDLGFRVVRVSTRAAQDSEGLASNAAAPKMDATDLSAPPLAAAPFEAKQARAHQEAWAAYLKRPVEQKNSINMPLVLIPPGEFTMGSTPEQIEAAQKLAEQGEGGEDKWSADRISAEAPAHRVTISRPFMIGATEVTIGQYRRFVDAANYVTQTERLGGGDSTKEDEQDPQKKALTWRAQDNSIEDAAVTQLTWNDAIAFCNWLSEAEKLSRCYQGSEQEGWQLKPAGDGYRLPTEAEWEYACRAGTTTQYSFGDDPSAFVEFGWSLRAGPVPHPHPVAAKLPNPFDLYDMHGNVNEWCNDWFGPDSYAQSSPNDPMGPASGEAKVLRSGALNLPIVRCRSAFRNAFSPIVRFYDLGFRVVRAATPSDAKRSPLAKSEEKPVDAAMPEQPAAKPRSLSELLDKEKQKTAEPMADAVSAKEAFTLKEHTGAVTRVAFHPFLPLLASAGKDGRVLLWDLEKKTLAGQFDNFKEEVWTVKFSPDGNLLAYANRYHWGSQVPFKAVATAKEVKRLKDFKFGGGAVGSIAYSPDGAFFAAGQDNGTIRLWETGGFQELPPLSVGSDVNSLVFGPIGFDRKRKPARYLLAAGCKDGSIKTLELAQVKDKNGSRWTFATTSVEFPKQMGVLCLRFSPDGKLLASCRFGGLISLFDPETGKPAGEMAVSNANIDWLCFHPSEPWLITAHWQDHRARIWNTKTQQMIYEFPKQPSGIFCAEFSRDGRRVATASDDFSITLWDLSGPGLPSAPKRAKKAKPSVAIVGD